MEGLWAQASENFYIIPSKESGSTDQDHNCKTLSNFLDFITGHAYFFILFSVAPMETFM